MPPAPPRVVVDANVLYPFSLRDTLLRAAAKGFFQLYWSEQILDEMTRSLVTSAGLSEGQAARLRSEMEKAFPEAMVSGYQRLIPSMRNQEKDRHVAAAAVRARATVLVTSNLRDFRAVPKGIAVQPPDTFLTDLFAVKGDAMVELLIEQAHALKKPAVSLHELLTGLAKHVPTFVQTVRAHEG
jgi:predicted nucleic acid-binding protein